MPVNGYGKPEEWSKAEDFFAKNSGESLFVTNVTELSDDIKSRLFEKAKANSPSLVLDRVSSRSMVAMTNKIIADEQNIPDKKPRTFDEVMIELKTQHLHKKYCDVSL